MKRKELNKILSFLQEKRNYFISERNEFVLNSSPSFSSIEPYFEFDLMPLKVEVVANVTTQGELKTVKFYNSIIDLLNKDNFADSYKDFAPNNKFEYYADRKAFLNQYYRDYPENGLGDGELEFIKICFDGFLYSYDQFKTEVIETINSCLPDIDQTQIPVEKHDYPIVMLEKSDDEIKAEIGNYLNFLNGYNGHNEKIMTDEEFERLKELTYKIIKNIPIDNKKPFNPKNVDAIKIRYTYYLLHKSIYSSRGINDAFIDFLKNHFTCFSNQERSTIKTKFSVKPKKY